MVCLGVEIYYTSGAFLGAESASNHHISTGNAVVGAPSSAARANSETGGIEAAQKSLTTACESACRYKDVPLTDQSQRICYSFWHFHYGEEKDEFSILINPSPDANTACLAAMRPARQKLMDFTCKLCDVSLPPASDHAEKNAEKNRGVVYTGASSHLALIYVSIKFLRLHEKDEDNKIPVEVYVDSDALGECSQRLEQRLTNVHCIAALAGDKSYANKLYAIRHSTFEEVLFLDADSLLMIHPDRLFNSREFTDTGAVFWPDLWGHACTHPSRADQVRSRHKNKRFFPKSMLNEYRSLAGQSTWPDHIVWDYTNVRWEPKWDHAQEFESGQLLVDKRRHDASLRLAQYLSRDEFAQNILYGDKDCFKFAWLMTGAAFTLAPDPPAQIGAVKQGVGEPVLRRFYVVQRFHGETAFIHQKSSKLQGDNAAAKRALAIPKPGFKWANSEYFDYSYCPGGYDPAPLGDLEWTMASDPLDHAMWDRFYDEFYS